MKNAIFKKMLGMSALGATLLTPVLAAADQVPSCLKADLKIALSEGGASDIGNGDEDIKVLEFAEYEADSYATWCSNVSDWIQDIKIEASSMYPAAGRLYIVRSVERILRAYQRGRVPFDPMTYSVLSRIRELDSIFPYCEGTGKKIVSEKGNSSAYLVAYHLLGVAQSINQDFDIPHWLDFANESPRCRGDWDEDLTDECGPVYLSYIQSARTLLEKLFSQAHRNAPTANVWDAMGVDRTELLAMEKITNWLAEDLQRDVFGRRFECVSDRLRGMNSKLRRYLGGSNRGDKISDRRMRVQMRSRLGEVLDTLDYFTPNYSNWSSCR